jgi:hypothetical protein
MSHYATLLELKDLRIRCAESEALTPAVQQRNVAFCPLMRHLPAFPKSFREEHERSVRRATCAIRGSSTHAQTSPRAWNARLRRRMT